MKSNLLTVKSVERLLRSGEGAMHNDGQGLFLKVLPSGAGSWIYRYRINGKRRDMGLGMVDVISLAEARSSASEARSLVRAGSDPIVLRRLLANPQVVAPAPEAKTFQQIAVEYIDTHRAGWKNVKHTQQWTNTLTTYAFPVIGAKSVAHVETEDVLTILTPIWGTKPETASRVRNRIELVLDAAKAHQLRSGENPARWRGHLDKLLPKRKVSDRGNHAALPWQQVPEFMAELRKSEDLSSLAVQLTVLCAMRTSEVLGATWGEIDLKAEIWTIPAARMKASRPHRIPLSKAVIAILYHLSPDTQNRLLFPGTHDHALYFVR